MFSKIFSELFAKHKVDFHVYQDMQSHAQVFYHIQFETWQTLHNSLIGRIAPTNLILNAMQDIK